MQKSWSRTSHIVKQIKHDDRVADSKTVQACMSLLVLPDHWESVSGIISWSLFHIGYLGVIDPPLVSALMSLPGNVSGLPMKVFVDGSLIRLAGHS